jgi:translation elongation factor aEF-1 beta
MATVVITFTIMPDDTETDLDAVTKAALEKIRVYTGDPEGEVRTSTAPVAFGLMSIKIIFVCTKENNPDELQAEITALEGVRSCELSDLRRAIG